MQSWIKQLFAAPDLENAFQARIAGILNVMLLVIFAATVIGTAVVIPIEPEEWLFNLLFGVVIALAILGLRRQMYRGRLGFVIISLSFILWVGITILLFTEGGIRDPTLSAYFLIIIVASLFMEGLGSIIFGAIILISTFVLTIIDMTGLVNFVSSPAGIIDIVTLSTTIILTSLLGYTAIRGMNQGLRSAQENERAQIEANRELQKIREELEERVASRTYDLERRAVQLQAAAEVGHAVATIRDLDELLPKVTNLISERFGFYHVGIFMLDDRGEYAILKAANSEGGQRMLMREHRLKVGEVGIVGYATGYREPRVALDVGKDAVYFDNPDLPDTRSEMALPLIVGGKLLGALDVQSRREAAFSNEDISMLQVLADQVSVAIENAYLFSEQEIVLDSVRRAYGEVSQASWGEFLRQQPDIGFISTRNFESLPATKSWTPDMIAASQRGEIIRADDYCIVIPIILRDQVLGVVRLQKPEDDNPWSEDEINLMDTIIDQLEAALESARLYRDTQQRAERERLVTEITTKIRATTDPQTMLHTAVSELREALKAQRAQMVIQSVESQE